MPADPPPLPDPLGRNWVWRTIQITLQNVFIFWLRYRVRGLEHIPQRGGALLLINHQSFLDPLLTACSFHRPVSYIARDNLFRVPVIGWILRNTYVFPIRRESAGADTIRESVRRLEHGFLVGIFPEGTRTSDGKLGEIKPGFVALVRRSKVPIIPVGIAGAFEAFPRGTLFVWPGTIRVVIGAPLNQDEVKQLSERGREQDFVALVTQRIGQCLQEATEWRGGNR